MTWKTSKTRVALHEAGHVVVAHSLMGIIQEAAVYRGLDGSWEGQALPTVGDDPKCPADWLNCVAWDWGGWAAVNEAISIRHLEAAPPGVEEEPGLVGFLGSDEQLALTHSVQADPDDPASAYAQGKALALATVKNCWDTVLAVAAEIEQFDVASEERLSDLLR
jgi:hypothetical protein